MENRKKKLIKTNSWFFKKIYKIDKPLPWLRKEETQFHNIRNVGGAITTDWTEVKRVKGQAVSQRCPSDDLDEGHRFLETRSQPRLHHRDIKGLSRPLTSQETELVIKKLPPWRAQNQMSSLVNSTKLLKMR